MKSDHRSKFSNFKKLEGKSLKSIRASTGFEPVVSAMEVDDDCLTHFHPQPQYNMNFIYISHLYTKRDELNRTNLKEVS